MAYIYKITNKINQKVYIGMTERNPAQRWLEHQTDYTRYNFEKRPLYDAIKKYGIQNFIFEILEETDNPIQREVDYIKEYNSFVGFQNSNGYNATLGGEGKSCSFSTKEEIEKLISLYNQKETCLSIGKEMGYDEETVSSKLQSLGFEVSKNRVRRKIVQQLDKNTEEIIKEFNSITEAATYLGSLSYKTHISAVCRGARKSAYGYKWRFIEE